jgi:hypothetical protein
MLHVAREFDPLVLAGLVNRDGGDDEIGIVEGA